MNRILITGNSVALDADGYANDVTAASGAAFTLAANDTTDGLGHKVVITPSGAVTGNYGISGNDANGYPISETLATDGANAVTSAKYYATDIVVTAPSGLGAETVDIGWAAASVSAWTFLERFGQFADALRFGAIVNSGTPTFTVQHTFDGGVTAFNHASVAAATTSSDGRYTDPVQALRLSWAAAGEVTLHGIF